jgi:tetratricopeptide (TPR) repeat protein
LKVAYNLLKEGAFKKAIDAFIEAEVLEETEEDKSKVNFIISKIYYAHLKNFPQARKYALKAAKQRPNWGEPYLLIGRLYASSGPLCGPGTGWDSQIVVWPALDKWNYAKTIDPSVSKEANKLIGQYARFMPSKEDLFFRTLQNGQSFRVGCWIQENTKIRTSD